MRLLFRRSDPSAHGEIDDVALSELYRHPEPNGRSVWLRTNFVASLDGSSQGSDGRSGSINTPSDHKIFALHRAHADAIVVGAQTVRVEGYRAVDLAPWQRTLRAELGLSPFPLLVIISRSLEVDPSVATAQPGPSGPVMIITTDGKTPAELEPLEAAGVDVVQLAAGDDPVQPAAGDDPVQLAPGDDTARVDPVQLAPDRVDLSAAMEYLGLAGYRRVLCEGGAHLHRDLLAADLVDEMSLTLAPLMVAGDGRHTTAGEFLTPARPFELRFALHSDDGALFLSYHRVPTTA